MPQVAFQENTTAYGHTARKLAAKLNVPEGRASSSFFSCSPHTLVDRSLLILVRFCID